MSAGRKNAISYTITTKVVRDGDGFAVYDEIQYDTGSLPSLICRFRGTEAECGAYAERLGEYWRQRLEGEPPPI